MTVTDVSRPADATHSPSKPATVITAPRPTSSTDKTVVMLGSGRAADLANVLAESQAVARRVAALGDTE